MATRPGRPDPTMISTEQPVTTDRNAGDEPIPGYVLIEPLGRGGFGEVWKCVAPGGLHKAVKFVPVGGDQFRQEAAAFERMRSVRHAFLLTLERVERVGGDLVMVMELADAQLQDLFEECRRNGLRGIPRDELLRYLSDAAEALDVIATRYGLQHLDVKPANLFLIDGHVKVGDYGLVRSLGAGQAAAGLTPKYAAPEVLKGHADARSDQYSLALVYHEMLTGSFPYSGRTAQQLMIQHVGSPPDLSALPEDDRAAIIRALAKTPADRFPSCTAFVRALAGLPAQGPGSSILPFPPPLPAADTVRVASGTTVTPIPVRTVEVPQPVRFPVVAWAPTLRPRPSRDGELTAADFIERVVATAKAESKLAEEPAGTHSCRFLCNTPDAHLPQKLSDMAKRFGMSMESPEPGVVVLRRTVHGQAIRGVRAAGELRVSVRRAAGGFETTASAALRGDPGGAAGKDALRAVPGLLAAVRGALENLREQRAHPRFQADFPVRIHIIADESVGEFEDGLCEDISAGGIGILTRTEIAEGRVYLEFRSIEGVAGNALLATVVRRSHGPKGHITTCRFES
jgi:serine/threonine protein kinase